ncbi:hypothetical protein SDC9_77638 [bioreactor metagenome]|uniref:Uncharacterized protein n=1 Tax=bioreactor metagenome TaxID=1076179 RepID=A0A644YR73_9ZZZZ
MVKIPEGWALWHQQFVVDILGRGFQAGDQHEEQGIESHHGEHAQHNIHYCLYCFLIPIGHLNSSS